MAALLGELFFVAGPVEPAFLAVEAAVFLTAVFFAPVLPALVLVDFPTVSFVVFFAVGVLAVVFVTETFAGVFAAFVAAFF